jgi:hypothetical protein
MRSCGGCHNNRVPASAPAVLFQIRRGYRAQWKELAFSVESDSGSWTLRVQDSAKRETLYTAHRSGSVAAQQAAAEFASLRVMGSESHLNIARLAEELKWHGYW